MQNYIFNRKYLSENLKRLKKEDIDSYDKRRQVITNWNYSLTESDLEKTKEVSIQGDFLHQIFNRVLGYKGRIGEKMWNLQAEKKTEVDATVADGSLGFYSDSISDTRVVIELKDARTDLDRKQKRENNQSPVEQAFSYQYKHRNCKWVIVSNFKEIRVYNARTMTEYEQFFMEELATNEETFKKFFYLLNRQNLINRDEPSLIDELYVRNEVEEKKITLDFYGEYKKIRKSLYEHIIEHNDIEELVAFEKTQKVLDRFIFVCFCEDTQLLPRNIFTQVVDAAKRSFSFSETRVWEQLKGLFHSIDKGNPHHNINRFNGGLFTKDDILDDLIIKDEIFELFTKMAEYDFESELSVNILGHVFEQSISDIEEFKAEILGEEVDKNKGARKRNGIFYTPSYITQFMVSKTIGSWLEKKRIELGEASLPVLKEEDYKEYRIKTNTKKIRRRVKVEDHIDFYTNLQEAIRNIKVLDPACGSGAFLNAAFDYLHLVGTDVNKKLEELTGLLSFFELDKHILKNNLYGVDLNKESVEISKLSLWIKTANKNDPLTSLDENILVGNSLIDSSEGGESSFIWEENFKGVFEDGGFDVIVGNPPYVRVQLLENKAVDYMFENYQTATGKLDISILFFEKALNLLNESGQASFISTSQWLQTDYGKGIRGLFSEGYITEIFDFGSLPVFGDADTYPAIFSFQNRAVESVSYKKIHTLDEVALKEPGAISYPYEKLNERAWNFSGFDLLDHLLTKKILAKPLMEYAEPLYGTTTGMDKVFVVNREKIKEFRLEEDLLYPYGYRGEEVESFSLTTPKAYVIYPYTKDSEGKLKLIEEQTLKNLYPNTYNYLLSFKEELKARKDSRKLYAEVDWYKLVRPSNFETIERRKIFVKGISTVAEAGYLLENTAFNGANCPAIIKYDDSVSFEYLLGLLNSDLVTNFLNAIVPKKLGGYYRYNTTNLRSIPIVIPNDPNRIGNVETLVNHLRSLKLEIAESKERLKRRLEDNLSVEKWTTKLQNAEQLSFKELLSELKKQKIDLNLAQQDEWEDYFTQIKGNIVLKKNEFDSAQQRLNLEVNAIYGLS